MYQEIKTLADAAVKRQNKIYMEEVLRQISDLAATALNRTMFTRMRLAHGSVSCTECGQPRGVAEGEMPQWVGESPETLQPVSHELPQQLADAEALMSVPGGFGMAHLKIEGCALHPDDIDAEMTPEQEARQLAAHERDVAAVTAKLKKGAKK